MKVGTKPISSPGRAAEKYYPPLLMRFLRTNMGARSRGRSVRSSPLLFGRKKTNLHHSTKKSKNDPSSLEAQQEPSSPKVTCMGQVRVRRSSSKHKDPNLCTPLPSLTRPRCSCCGVLKDKIRVKPRRKFGSFRRPSCPKWGFVFTAKKGRSFGEEDSGNAPKKNEEQSEEDEEEDEGGGGGRVRAYISAPPKDALLLTRCRSAPYRSSSLQCRFWSEETEDPKQSVDVNFDPGEENSIGSEPTSGSKRESSSKEEFDVGLESEVKVKVGVVEEYIDLSRHGNNGISRDLKDEELIRRVVEDGGGTLRAWTLTRCKSEPARTGDEKNHELGFWKKRRQWVGIRKKMER